MKQNTDEVICPNCVHQFRAIPEDVQKLMLGAGFEPPFTSPPARKPASTITITQRGSTRTIDNHFEDCVRDWPDGEYKLYTSPQPAQRKPLTDGEIWKDDGIMAANSGYGAAFETLRELVRAVEATHGIKE